MTERRQLTTLFAVALIIGGVTAGLTFLIPPALEGDLVIDEYRATFSDQGELVEEYTYDVKNSGQYRFLFRYWREDLSLEELSTPHIQLEGMKYPSGSVGYIKDHQGEVTLYGSDDPSIRSTIRSLAYYNEVGIFDPGYFDSGLYEVEFTFVLHPTIEYDDQYSHLNIRLVDEHIPYRSSTIIYPSQYVQEVFPHPPYMEVVDDGTAVTMSGSVPADEVLGIELLLSPEAKEELDGFPTFVEDVRDKTLEANPWTDILPYYGAWTLYILGMVLVVLIPFLFLLIYHLRGREREQTVPEYISFVPNRDMKPWAVNLLFKGDAIVFDEDGYYATLLDLHRREMIEIKEVPGTERVIITLRESESDDKYEQKVLGFLWDVSANGVVDSDELKRLSKEAQRNKYMESRILRYQRTLSDVTRRSDPRLIERYVINGRKYVAPLVILGVVFLLATIVVIAAATTLLALLIPAVILSIAMIVQSGVAMAYPSTLFGNWKGDGYREKLQWDAFAYFLSDLALIRQYEPSDIRMWGEWLVYGTALGVGDKVEKAMKSLHVNIPDVGVPLGVRFVFVPIIYFRPPSAGAGPGGFGGGGAFGGGGGFGGGGVGGR